MVRRVRRQLNRATEQLETNAEDADLEASATLTAAGALSNGIALQRQAAGGVVDLAFGSDGIAADKKSEGKGGKAPQASIGLKPWNPKTPYMKAIREVKPDKAYAVYLEQRAKHGASPAFYLDVADYLLQSGRHKEGVRVLTSVLDLGIEDARLIRIVAHKLQQVGELDDAIDLFKRVQDLRPEEPQSYRPRP